MIATSENPQEGWTFVPRFMSRANAALCFALLWSLPAHSKPFEGVVDIELVTSREGAHEVSRRSTIFISPRGVRSDVISFGSSRLPDAVELALSTHPDVKFVLAPEKHTYRQHRESPQRAPEGAEEKFVVSSRRKEQLRGHSCVHVVVRGEKGTKVDQWLTSEVPNFLAAIGKTANLAWLHNPALAHDRDIQRLTPIRTVLAQKGGVRLTLDVLAVRQQHLSQSLFTLDGYRQLPDAERD
jgi:hypothetical protein